MKRRALASGVGSLLFAVAAARADISPPPRAKITLELTVEGQASVPQLEPPKPSPSSAPPAGRSSSCGCDLAASTSSAPGLAVLLPLGPARATRARRS
ncbi:MAG: hypothetical protein L6Q84_07230 [Polyangiaceae bacterium]|nr:hypothetical protein [Polyangiaceae bacterium]